MANAEREESYGQHSPNYLKRKRAKEGERKTALKTKTRDEGYASPGTVGALAGLRRSQQQPGENPQAPQRIGDLMTPSTIGREGPPSSEQEFQERRQRNSSFLKSRETQAALLQFGISMLSSAGGGNFMGNIGKSLALAAGAPSRLHQADRELQAEERKAELAERGMDISERRMGLEETELGLKAEQMRKRQDIFGGLTGDASDDDLIDRAAELASIGDTEGANLVLKMMKSSADPALYQEMKQYQFDVSQGYVGTLFQWRKDKGNITVMARIEDNLSKGVYTIATMPPGDRAVWDAHMKADTMAQVLLKLLGGEGIDVPQAGEEPGATGAPPQSGASGDVPFTVRPVRP